MVFVGLLIAVAGVLLIISGWTNYSLSSLVSGKPVRRS